MKRPSPALRTVYGLDLRYYYLGYPHGCQKCQAGWTSGLSALLRRISDVLIALFRLMSSEKTKI